VRDEVPLKDLNWKCGLNLPELCFYDDNRQPQRNHFWNIPGGDIINI